jgi:predicted butyrate kinase (DUF1464 family)
MSPISEPDFTLNKIQLELAELKSSLIPSEILLREIESVKKHQEETKQDLKEIKKMLLDPNDGIIVKVNKNTEFREEQKNENKEHEKLLREHEEVMKWKSGIIKFLWVVVSGIFASIGYIFSELRNP